ncbi:hypothetical protein CRYUN_Cryun07bG0108700 [Craigia yunnanensis]
MASKPNPIHSENPQKSNASLSSSVNSPIFISCESSLHTFPPLLNPTLPLFSPHSLLNNQYPNPPKLPRFTILLSSPYALLVLIAFSSLHSSTTGQPLASMDGTELTLYRTACVSGLA